MLFADLHCHPAMRPFNNGTKTVWEPNPNQKLDKMIDAQLKGKRGALYDQSGYPKLQTGKVRLVFASLYPLEKGFLKNSSILLHGLNVAKFLVTLPVAWLKGFFSPKFSFRDIFLASFTKYKSQRLVDLKTEGYWEGFLKEAQYYIDEHNTIAPMGPRAKEEIARLISDASIPIGDPAEHGTFTIADRSNPPDLIPNDRVITILTMEGMGTLSQERTTPGLITDLSLRNLEKQEILNRIQYVKNTLPVFFITYCHHFDNGLCGHARSMPVIAQSLGLLDQGDRLSKGFNQLGFDILKYLLAVKEQNGQVVDDPTAGRRVLIDLKHMSIEGRLAVYDLVEKYNAPLTVKERIPLIASHVGFSGFSTEQLVDNIVTGEENDKNQISIKSIGGRELRFNTWSINLGRQEVRRIINSGGLIGLSLEQNILGVGFFEKTKKVDISFHADLLVHQLLIMAQEAGTKEFWKHVSIGTDFDGIINPVDRYSSALFFTVMRNEIEDRLGNLSVAERMGYHLPPKEQNDELDTHQIAKVMDDFCFNNAFEFVKTYFKHQDMPDLKQVFA